MPRASCWERVQLDLIGVGGGERDKQDCYLSGFGGSLFREKAYGLSCYKSSVLESQVSLEAFQTEGRVWPDGAEPKAMRGRCLLGGQQWLPTTGSCKSVYYTVGYIEGGQRPFPNPPWNRLRLILHCGFLPEWTPRWRTKTPCLVFPAF